MLSLNLKFVPATVWLGSLVASRRRYMHMITMLSEATRLVLTTNPIQVYY